ncbi:odorant receptor Or1-like [Zophobas morio]|uniref:odorant receptor Or1-like n=1 Tax=Zophobas morio TaxID=2755281 RepID=UPI0030832C31
MEEMVNMNNVEQYNWKDNFDINIRFLRKMGLWPEGEGTYKPGFYMFYSAFMVTLFPTCHILSEIVDMYILRDNLEAVVGIIYVTLIEVMAWIKIYFVITRIQVLKERMENLKADWFQPKDRDQLLMIEPSINFWKIVYKMLLVTCFACNFFWLIPLLIRRKDEKNLPFLAWYPFDCSNSPYFEITYVYQICSTSYCTLVHTNVDTLISGFNVYIGCQFDMLSDNLRGMVEKRAKDEIQARSNLIKCVIYHKQILR